MNHSQPLPTASEMEKKEDLIGVSISTESPGNMDLKLSDTSGKKKRKKNRKKHPAEKLDVSSMENNTKNSNNGMVDNVDDDLNKPTMGEKLESLMILEKEIKPPETESPPDTNVPSDTSGMVTKEKKKRNKKKRPAEKLDASSLENNTETSKDGTVDDVDCDLNVPTMGEKLENLIILEKDEKPPNTNVPSDASGKLKKKRHKKKPFTEKLDASSMEDSTKTSNNGMVDNIDFNEPTMGEKLENLMILEKESEPPEKESPPDINVPSADSVHVMLKQALNAEDRDLLLQCMYSRDDKVISNSVAQLSPSDVLKFLNSLISMTQQRGAILVFALPWLKNLIVQHASSIIAQESSLIKLNSLYQLIESRTSTFESALKLSTCIDFLFAGVLEEEDEEESMPPPVIYQDTDSDEESADGMNIDEDNNDLAPNNEFPNDSEGSDVMSQ